MTEELIGPLTKDPGQQAREATKKKRAHDQITVAESEVGNRLADGWEHVKKLKGHRVKLQRTRPIDVQLENRVWYLFYLMGYPEIGGGKDFKIRFTRKNEQESTKQFDVFAKDGETVVVVECKASDKPRKRSL